MKTVRQRGTLVDRAEVDGPAEKD